MLMPIAPKETAPPLATQCLFLSVSLQFQFGISSALVGA